MICMESSPAEARCPSKESIAEPFPSPPSALLCECSRDMTDRALLCFREHCESGPNPCDERREYPFCHRSSTPFSVSRLRRPAALGCALSSHLSSSGSHLVRVPRSSFFGKHSTRPSSETNGEYAKPRCCDWCAQKFDALPAVGR